MEKVLSLLLAAVTVFGFGCVTAFAEGGTAADGCYTAAAVFTDIDSRLSVASIFADTADVTVSGDTVVMSVCAADPVPVADGASAENISVVNPTITIDGMDYTGIIGVQDTTRVFHESSGLFTIADGTVLTCDTITFVLPASAFTAGGTSSFVMTMHIDPVLNDEISVRLDISGIPAAAAEEETGVFGDAAEAALDDAEEISFDGAAEEPDGEEQAAEPSYTVTVPQSVSMGSLSAVTDTVIDYTVTVEAADMGGAYIDILCDDIGILDSESDTLVFENKLTGNTGIRENKDITGTLTVSASGAAEAAPGSYEGTLKFTINYYEG